MSDVTLATLRTRIAKRAGVTVSPAARHTPDDVNDAINESTQAYHQILIECGHPQRVTRATATTSSSTTVTLGWPLNEYVSLPSDFLDLQSAFISDGSRSYAMTAFSESERDDFESSLLNSAGIPQQFRIGEDSSGGKILRLLPAASGAYTITLTYTAVLTALGDDDDTFNFLPGTSEWVVCDVAMKLLEDDDETGGAYQAIARRHMTQEQLLRRKAGRINRAGPSRMQETDRIHRRNRLLRYPR